MEKPKVFKEIKADLWLPKVVNEKREGEVNNINEKGLYGLSVSVKQQNGDIVLLPSHKMLQGLLAQAELRLGSYIIVTYLGTKPTKIKGQSDTTQYKLEVGQ